jgi:hypothetical protein
MDDMLVDERHTRIDVFWESGTFQFWNASSWDKVEVPETVRIRRFAYEKWVYFFEKFYVYGEEEIVMR